MPKRWIGNSHSDLLASWLKSINILQFKSLVKKKRMKIDLDKISTCYCIGLKKNPKRRPAWIANRVDEARTGSYHFFNHP